MSDPSSFLTDFWNDPLSFDETKKNGGRYPERDALRLNGDGVLLYPGRPLGLKAPNSSLRLELVAAGLQISDEAALLARLGHAPEARALMARVIPGTASFADSPAAWQSLERELLRRIERAQ